MQMPRVPFLLMQAEEAKVEEAKAEEAKAEEKEEEESGHPSSTPVSEEDHA